MNTVPEFLEHLRTKNIFVRLDGDRLRCSAPPGALTTTLSEEIQVRKSRWPSMMRSAKPVPPLA